MHLVDKYDSQVPSRSARCITRLHMELTWRSPVNRPDTVQHCPGEKRLSAGHEATDHALAAIPDTPSCKLRGYLPHLLLSRTVNLVMQCEVILAALAYDMLVYHRRLHPCHRC